MSPSADSGHSHSSPKRPVKPHVHCGITGEGRIGHGPWSAPHDQVITALPAAIWPFPGGALGRYSSRMAVPRTDGFVDPCIPTPAAKAPSWADWVHAYKHDGYRLIVRRDGRTVRLFTRRGHDWTERYPAIAGAAAKLRARSFTLDGEAVVCGTDGVAVFDALHRRRRASDAILLPST